MFTKTGELKKFMKSALKSYGLRIANTGEQIMVWTDCWGISVEEIHASNKFKAAIMELIGDIPEKYEAYNYMIDSNGVTIEPILNVMDPYEDWKHAKEFAKMAPVFLYAFPHEYAVFQTENTLSLMAVDRRYTNAISTSEKDDNEPFPDHADVLSNNVLYFKNDRMIYWIRREVMSDKFEDTLFDCLKNLDFYDKEFKPHTQETEESEEEDGEQMELPY